jgi:hypothetical protein
MQEKCHKAMPFRLFSTCLYWTSEAFRRSVLDAKAYLSSTHWFAGRWQFVRANGAG